MALRTSFNGHSIVISALYVIEGTDVLFAEKEYISVYQQPIDLKSLNRYKAGKQSILLYEVHVYAAGSAVNSEQRVAIPLSDIQKIELYKKDWDATIKSHLLGAIPIAAAIITFWLIAANSSFY